MLKKILYITLFVGCTFSYSQTTRNSLLEYCTGTWCQWCPCGHTVIANNIIPNFPKTVILSYHGPANTPSDPYATFSGNQIISALGFNSYPTGIIDRTGSPSSNSSWYPAIFNRSAVPAKADISVVKSYNSINRELTITVYVTALQNITTPAALNIVLTEDQLNYPQTGNASCPGNTDYKHSHVVRSMLNGHLGEDLNGTNEWFAGQTITKSYQWTINSAWKAENCKIAVFSYVKNTTLNRSEVMQAKEWSLMGDILPVELVSFAADIRKGFIDLNWKTASELNNQGFEVERSYDGVNFANIGFIPGAGTVVEEKTYHFSDIADYNSRTLVNYRLKQVDFTGEFEYSDVIEVLYDFPVEFSLLQNYPNPFNPSTVLEYSIADEGLVTLRVFDVMGNEVQELVRSQQIPGTYKVEFDGSNLTSGIYFYKLTSSSFVKTGKMILNK